MELTTNLTLPCCVCGGRSRLMYYRFKDVPTGSYFETDARCEGCIVAEKFTTSKSPTTPKPKIKFLDVKTSGFGVEF